MTRAMMIDISNVLRQTLACDLYSNLVTRPTGAAVRVQIEQMLDQNTGDAELTVIDFSHVPVIDFSCADEVIAKLLLRYAADDPPQEAYFLFRGVSEDHWTAIEAVLERHELAMVMERGDHVDVVGVVTEVERRVWNVVTRLGGATPDDVARDLEIDDQTVGRALDRLQRRRLAMRAADRYYAV